MREAVIVSTARTGIGRAFKGALNHTKSPSLLGHVIAQAVERAHVEGAEVDDVVMGTVLSTIRIASTAAPSAPILSPRPTQRLAAMAADSVVRTSSRARLRSGRSVVITYKPSALTNLRSCPFCQSSCAFQVSRSLTFWCAQGANGCQELSQTASLAFYGCGQSMAVHWLIFSLMGPRVVVGCLVGCMCGVTTGKFFM